MRILVSGATGFVGRALLFHFGRKRYDVVSLLREIDASGLVAWRAQDGSSLEDFDAVIHLAGEPLTFGRWSEKKKEKILNSRAEGTKILSASLAILRNPPSIFISASAVGYYGDRGEELLDEGSAGGEGFLADVCREWESATRLIDSRGARTVHARFGMVLGPNGGALKKMVPLYRLGLGGRFSTGEQWVSWIELDDLVLALDHILHTKSLKGPVNVVSPRPLRQRDFNKELAKILKRPAFFHMPAWLLRLTLGTVADELLLSSAHVIPRKLSQSGFCFNYPDIESAFKKILNCKA